MIATQNTLSSCSMWLAERLADAMQTVGLSGSDLCRVGLLRVISEIEATVSLSVGATPQVRAARA